MMRRIHELTHFQKQFSEDHINLVYRFLRCKQLPADEFYDVVIFGYLAAVQEYDERLELSQFKFSTIAWSRMQECLCQYYKYKCRPIRNASTISLCSVTDAGTSLDDLIPFRKKDIQDQTADRMLAMEIMSHLTETERQLVTLKANGMTIREIAKLFSLSQSGIQSRFGRMRKRLSLILEQ